MAGQMAIPRLICIGSDGLKFYSYHTQSGLTLHKSVPSDNIRSITYTTNGKSVAFCDEIVITVCHVDNFTTALEIPAPKVSRYILSPCGSVLVTYRTLYTDANAPQGHPNLLFYDVKSGVLLKECIHREADSWRPQWTADASVCARHTNGEIHFYVNNNFAEPPTAKLVVRGMRHFSLTKSSASPHLAVYIPGQKGQPSTVRVYQWHDGQCTSVANKSFFRADSVSLLWNDRGTDLLILTSTKMSDQSYYGEQGLYYMTTGRSGDSAIVNMPRPGPIYQVAWKPNSDALAAETGSVKNRPKAQDLFAVCHGTMPASVTVFGMDCEVRFDFGTGPWNQLHFNPHGTILLLGGFGNLPGNITVWDFNKQEKLSEFQGTDTTSLAWAPDGEHLVLATTTPRLRVNNGFSIWHYDGHRLLFQPVERRATPRPATMDLPASLDHELYQVVLLPVPELPPAPKLKKGVIGEQTVTKGMVIPNRPAAYVPPALRNRSATAIQSINASAPSHGLNTVYQAPSRDRQRDAETPAVNRPRKGKNKVTSSATGAVEQPNTTSNHEVAQSAKNKNKKKKKKKPVGGDSVTTDQSELCETEELINLPKQMDRLAM